MKRFCALLLACILLTGAVPCTSFAAAKQMNAGVPVWTEETVRQYALDYVEGKSMDRLWGYYDLQIRRYLALESYAKMLTDLHFMTGAFEGLGSYRSFEEPENQLKVHVIHLCMEKQDVDLYFTHKDKEDDWEVMAIEFVPAKEEEPLDAFEVERITYAEKVVTIGQAPYLLEGILTLPIEADAETPVPACVLVHDFEMGDRDGTLGKTTLFADFADQFAQMGIATLRYDKRTYAYPDETFETLSEEVVEDAILAAQVLAATPEVDENHIFVVGVGLGGMLTPRIASVSDGLVSGMIMIGSSLENLVDIYFQNEKLNVAAMPKEEGEAIRTAVRNMYRIKEEKARSVELFGRNGYYFWEFQQYDAVKLMRTLKLPMYYAQGMRDEETTQANGRDAYSKQVGPNARFATYQLFRGLNHLLMDDTSTDINGEAKYEVETHLDIQAARTLALWILNIASNSK